MADFPTLSKQFDANTLDIQSENPVGGSGDTGAGYEYTRPKWTRRPRRTFTFTFKSITAADRVALQNFWDTHFGGSVAFNWTDPTTSTVYNVRFSKEMQLKFSRDGAGNLNLYNTDPIIMKEV